MLTSKSLTRMKINHNIVIEKNEYDNYNQVSKDNKYITLIILNKKFQEEYNTFDNLGDTKSKGPGAARNFVWNHSINKGFSHHWVMDDNIYRFFRLNKNRQFEVMSIAFFRAMEDFCLRYINIAMAGPQYFMFAPRKSKMPPLILNTRIYYCNFLKKSIPFRWRGRYNEDTDLSVRILKSGQCTVQFNAFLQQKAPTQTVKGGCSKEFYDNEGTYNKSRMQVDMHPDISKLVYRFGRVHHHVNYSGFKKNKLIRKKGFNFNELPEINDYGMKLEKVNE